MGFSMTGLLIVLIIFLPNLLYIIYPPQNIPEDLKDVSLLFTALERVGQVSFFALLIMSKDNYSNLKVDMWLVLMIVCIIVYYGLWIRYLVKGKQFSILFKPLWMIPIPMAIFPILAFGFAAIWGSSIYLGIAVIIFAFGHLVNSWHSYVHSR